MIIRSASPTAKAGCAVKRYGMRRPASAQRAVVPGEARANPGLRPDVDTTAADMLLDLDEELNAAGTSLVSAALQSRVRTKLQR
jgi:hypothetical protein